jgi:hypothetical protein
VGICRRDRYIGRNTLSAHRTSRASFFLVVCGSFLACGEAPAASCDLEGNCLPSFACMAGRCVQATESIEGSNCGLAGCTIRGPDGAEVVIPARALTENLQLSLRLASNGLFTGDLNRISSIYALEPKGRYLQVRGRFEFLLRPEFGLESTDVRVYWAPEPGAGWIALTGSNEEMLAVGEFDKFGLFMVARP